MKLFAELLLRLVLALWVGGMAIFTFLITPALFRGFGRDGAGRIVNALFPLYFPYNLILSAVALVAFVVALWGTWRAAHWVPVVLLVLAVAANVYAMFVLHPEIRTVKSEISSFATIPPDDPVRRRFSRLHAVSAAVNLLVLADGVALLLTIPSLSR